MTDPVTQRAQIFELAVRFACPACETGLDSYVDTDEDIDGSYIVAPDQQFELCSHCGALLDFGRRILPEAEE